jgi:hypothetical protein
MWKHMIGDSTVELTTSSTSSMKGRNSSSDGSDLDKSNILNPTFNTLTEEGHKAFEAHRANVEVHFLSHCKVTQHGIVLKDTTSIIFHMPGVIPEVCLDPSQSCNDIQSMINSV